MIPRKQLDIGWTDLACGLARCLLPAARDTLHNRLAQQWSSHDTALACLSVRSGFDLMLQHLALPRGSEILVSAITIRDMVTIIEHHGLRAVPVDIDPADCAMRCDLAEAAITPRTRAILIAHLFGSRMNMTNIIALARRHKLLVFEDCAQAYAADGYRGHPGSDVALFSFGSIKTATALGGAMLTFRDAALCAAIRQMQHGYPVQSRWLYLRRILKHACLKALACRLPYTIFTAWCRASGTEHDRIISNAVRGFRGVDLMRNIRHQPSQPLLALLNRRLRNYRPHHLASRIAAAREAAGCLPSFQFAGSRNANHTHWVLPLLSTQPDRLVRHLWENGIDATRGATSLFAVPPTDSSQTAPAAARHLIDSAVYLPIDEVSKPEIQRMANVIMNFEATVPSPAETALVHER